MHCEKAKYLISAQPSHCFIPWRRNPNQIVLQTAVAQQKTGHKVEEIRINEYPKCPHHFDTDLTSAAPKPNPQHAN